MSKNYELAGYELATPLITAAGLINGPQANRLRRDVETLADTEVGAITVGSWTIERRLGNAALFGEPTDHYDHRTGEMTNALGLPNVGLDQGEQLVEPLKRQAGDKPIIFSASPAEASQSAGDVIDQSQQLVRRLFAAGADLVELNVSCPNVVDQTGDRKPIMGHDPQTMDRLADSLDNDPDAGHYRQRLGLKLPPYIGPEQRLARLAIGRSLSQGPFGFLVVSNTIPNHRPVDSQGQPRLSVPGGFGGLSGPATKEEGQRQLELWRLNLPEKPVVSTLGVFDGAEVANRLKAGADAVAMNCRFWQSRNWKRTVTEILVELSQAADDEMF